MTFKPNPNYLADNRSELFKAHSKDDAIDALDAEFWANEFHQESANGLNHYANGAKSSGVHLSWPISGDTIAAIRATA